MMGRRWTRSIATIEASWRDKGANLTMYFWKRLFSSNDEHTLWRPALKHIFPDKSVSRALVANHLEALYQTRNRIAHRDPVYGHRLEQAEAAIEFVATGLRRGDTTGATPLEKLLRVEMAELETRTETTNRLLAKPFRPKESGQ